MFKGEDPSEALEKLDLAAAMCEKFKDAYFQTKAKLKQSNSAREWKFDMPLIFTRIELFLSRIEEVKNMLQTIADFHRLEKVEIGGTKVPRFTCACVVSQSSEFLTIAFCMGAIVRFLLSRTMCVGSHLERPGYLDLQRVPRDRREVCRDRFRLPRHR